VNAAFWHLKTACCTGRSVKLRLMTDAAQVSLDGRTFSGAEMSDQGEASEATVFEYHEDGGVVWARYEGGSVRLGFLVGTRNGDRIDFRYSQLNAMGETSNGHCSSQIVVLADGRVRLNEVWSWESKTGEGASAVEERVRERFSKS
jgi:hypothetical protein